MAQKWRSASSRRNSAPPPLDGAALEALALAYVGRYATSRGRLAAYLARKLRERGWEGPEAPPVAAITERMADLRYVDDKAFAAMKADGMVRRGLGARRIGEALLRDGIDEDDREEAAPDPAARWAAAERFARRRRVGPFASAPVDRPQREKQLAAFLRAGHDMATARAWVDARPDEFPDPPQD